jgi:hypothetical protein
MVLGGKPRHSIEVLNIAGDPSQQKRFRMTSFLPFRQPTGLPR